MNKKEYNINYIISIYPSKFDGYQSKKGNQGYITAYISNLWDHAKNGFCGIGPFQLFVNLLNSIFIHERYCLERAFQKIRIKGGMCNPCCVKNIVNNTIEYLFGLNYG